MTPTLGEIAELLNGLKDRGVTLESLVWVAREKVWWEEADAETCPNDDLRCSCAVGKGHRAT